MRQVSPKRGRKAGGPSAPAESESARRDGSPSESNRSATASAKASPDNDTPERAASIVTNPTPQPSDVPPEKEASATVGRSNSVEKLAGAQAAGAEAQSGSLKGKPTAQTATAVGAGAAVTGGHHSGAAKNKEPSQGQGSAIPKKRAGAASGSNTNKQTSAGQKQAAAKLKRAAASTAHTERQKDNPAGRQKDTRVLSEPPDERIDTVDATRLAASPAPPTPEEPSSGGTDDYVARSPIVEMVGVGPCVHRLIRLNEEQRRRTKANSLDDFWRPFVEEYFAPNAKLLLDVYNDIARTPRSIELPCDVIARIYKIKYDSGILEEKLLMENPCEFLLRNGIVVVDCPRATVLTVYKHSKVCTEGHLRVSFSNKMKILCWEFSTKSHEELVNRCATTLPAQAANELGLSQTVSRAMKIAEAINELRPLISKTVKANTQKAEQRQAHMSGNTAMDGGAVTANRHNQSENSAAHDERNSTSWFEPAGRESSGGLSYKRRKS